MATLEQHKEQVRIEHPENTVKVQINGSDTFLSGDEYDSWVDDVAASRLDDEQNGYKEDRKKAYPSFLEFVEAYTEKEILEDSTKWDAYVLKYNKVRTDNPKP